MRVKLFRQSRKYGTFCVEFDHEDASKVLSCSWTLHKRKHVSYARGWDGKRRIALHRLIAEPAPGERVDHIDSNGLNNTRANLRLCSRSQNRHNTPKRWGSRSKYKGVVPANRKSQPWQALCMVDGRRHYSKRFATEEDAARAYDEMAKRLHGEFAALNFPVVFGRRMDVRTKKD